MKTLILFLFTFGLLIPNLFSSEGPNYRDMPLDELVTYMEQDDPAALHELGDRHLHGRGVIKDLNVARALWRESAALDYVPAIHTLGLLYYGKVSNPDREELAFHDLEEARRQFEIAAGKGYLPSIYYLGLMNFHGHGRSPDIQKGLENLLRAAEAEYPDAQATLGSIYFTGLDKKPDYALALHWYNKAAENMQRDAQFHLALMYLRGYGIPVDKYKASFWLRIYQDGFGEFDPESVDAAMDMDNREITSDMIEQAELEFTWEQLEQVHKDIAAWKQSYQP